MNPRGTIVVVDAVSAVILSQVELVSSCREKLPMFSATMLAIRKTQVRVITVAMLSVKAPVCVSEDISLPGALAVGVLECVLVEDLAIGYVGFIFSSSREDIQIVICISSLQSKELSWW